MKKLFVLFAAIVALGTSGFGQKKPPVDPCLSKDPKIRATSKKPCPSAPTQKRNVDPPEGADKTPAKKRANRAASVEDSTFTMTIEHNGTKTVVSSDQFKTRGGNFLGNAGDNRGRTMFTFGASNDTDDKSFSFQGWDPGTKPGVYQMPSENGETGITIMTSAFPNVPIFGAKSGTVEIITMPAPGGFVVGKFSIIAENVTNDGQTETYNISGNFSLYRMN